MLGWHPCSQGIGVYVPALDAVIALGCGLQMNGTCQCYTEPFRVHIKGPLRDYSVSIHSSTTHALTSTNCQLFTSSNPELFTPSYLHTLNNHNAFLHHRRNTPCQHRHCDARPSPTRLQRPLLQGQLWCEWHQLRQPHLRGLAFHGHREEEGLHLLLRLSDRRLKDTT